jgi:arginyl-tRNA--protein-N-Asp/Glu arginylyltransferase
MLNEMECDCRIRLKDTNYKETNYVLLEPDAYEECVQIYIKYCQYKQFGDMIPLFKEEFSLDIAERIGYTDKDNRLCAFSVIWKLPSVNSLYTSYFAWDYLNPELRIGNKSVRSEIARYKRLGYDYYYLGPAMPYKKQLQGYEIADVTKTFKFKNNHVIWH